MNLLTEQDNPLLTELGASLSDESAGASVMEHNLSGIAEMSLAAFASMTGALAGNAGLKLNAQQGSAIAPQGLGATHKVVTADANIDQYLLAWFNGNPNDTPVSIAIDNGASFEPAYTWENPGTIRPAIIKIAGVKVQEDGLNHQITVAARTRYAGRESPLSSVILYAKTPTPAVAPPEQCAATLLRQASATIGDLSRITWSHEGAVKIVARIGPVGHKKTISNVTVGYAGHADTEFYADNLCLYCGESGRELVNVQFGIEAISNGKTSETTYAPPVQVIDFKPQAPKPPKNPDEIAGTPLYWDLGSVLYAVADDMGLGYSTIQGIVNTALVELKRIVSQGGSVAIDDVGAFSAYWTKEGYRFSRTSQEAMVIPPERKPRFTMSPGFRVGVLRGAVLTDHQAES